MSQLERVAESKKASKGRKPSNGREWHGFVDVPLAANDKELLGDAVFTAEQLVEFLESAAAQGYKVALTPDWEHNCTIATATGVGSRNPNLGYSLSARGPDTVGALMVLAYKVQVLCDWGAWADHGSSRDNSPFA